MIRVAAALMLVAILPATAHAATKSASTPACAQPVVLTGQLASWSAPHAKLAGATSLADAAAARIVPGKTTDIGLFGAKTVKYGNTGARQRDYGFGGIVSFDTRAAGNWRVVIGSRAWIDVVDQGKAVTSSMHGRPPACAGIAKMVNFTLPAGRHTLLISSSPAPLATVLVTRTS